MEANNLKQPFFSIVIATYNSAGTLGFTLESIKGQSIGADEVEVIVVDGGSTDKTREIAASYGAVVLENPERLPEFAKAVGSAYAHGRFLMRMDSDEEFSYAEQLAEKKALLEKHPEAKMLISNRILSGKRGICGISANYMNILGDPFSYFVYQTKKDKYHTYMENVEKVEGREVIMRFREGDVYPLADSATCALDLEYMREKYPEEYATVGFICRAYDQVLTDTEVCAVMIGDDVLHNCKSDFRTYLAKLKFRVINNLFHKEESGYSAKENFSPKLQRRKMLFCLYAALIPVPILDSVRLAAVYRDPTFLLHFVYLYYVCFQIAKLGLVKVFGGNRKNASYG